MTRKGLYLGMAHESEKVYIPYFTKFVMDYLISKEEPLFLFQIECYYSDNKELSSIVSEERYDEIGREVMLKVVRNNRHLNLDRVCGVMDYCIKQKYKIYTTQLFLALIANLKKNNPLFMDSAEEIERRKICYTMRMEYLRIKATFDAETLIDLIKDLKTNSDLYETLVVQAKSNAVRQDKMGYKIVPYLLDLLQQMPHKAEEIISLIPKVSETSNKPWWIIVRLNRLKDLPESFDEKLYQCKFAVLKNAQWYLQQDVAKAVKEQSKLGATTWNMDVINYLSSLSHMPEDWRLLLTYVRDLPSRELVGLPSAQVFIGKCLKKEELQKETLDFLGVMVRLQMTKEIPNNFTNDNWHLENWDKFSPLLKSWIELVLVKAHYFCEGKKQLFCLLAILDLASVDLKNLEKHKSKMHHMIKGGMRIYASNRYEPYDLSLLKERLLKFADDEVMTNTVKEIVTSLLENLLHTKVMNARQKGVVRTLEADWKINLSSAWTRNQELEDMDEEMHQEHILKERSKNQDIKRFLEMLKK